MAAKRGYSREEARAHLGMELALERAALRGVGEDLGGDAAALGGIGQELVDDIVGVEGFDAEVVEHLRRKRLAAGDAAGEGDSG